jgi:hypothetical protein
LPRNRAIRPSFEWCELQRQVEAAASDALMVAGAPF